jgi:hypothetical protein
VGEIGGWIGGYLRGGESIRDAVEHGRKQKLGNQRAGGEAEKRLAGWRMEN